MYEVKESDWKLYKRDFSLWRDIYVSQFLGKYLKIINKELMSLEIFWDLEENIFQDKKKICILEEIKRSTMLENIILLIRENVINMNDLSRYSEELKNFIIDILPPKAKIRRVK